MPRTTEMALCRLRIGRIPLTHGFWWREVHPVLRGLPGPPDCGTRVGQSWFRVLSRVLSPSAGTKQVGTASNWRWGFVHAALTADFKAFEVCPPPKT